MALAEATGNAQAALPYTIVINQDGIITQHLLRSRSSETIRDGV